MQAIDINSGVWLAIRDHLNAEIEHCKDELCKQLSSEKTVELRARVAAAKNLLELPETLARKQSREPDYPM